MENEINPLQVLSSYVSANSSECLRIWSNTVENSAGVTVAVFGTHEQACAALFYLRQQN